MGNVSVSAEYLTQDDGFGRGVFVHRLVAPKSYGTWSVSAFPIPWMMRLAILAALRQPTGV
jgi:hypothetical protein